MAAEANDVDTVLSALRRRFPGEVPEFDRRDFMWAHGTPVSALLYAELFWPTFVVREDMVFWVGQCEDDLNKLRGVLAHYDGDVTTTERSYNNIEVWELFATDPDDVSDEAWSALAQTLRDCWQARLENMFPERRFVVEVIEPTSADDNLYLHFYQDRG